MFDFFTDMMHAEFDHESVLANQSPFSFSSDLSEPFFCRLIDQEQLDLLSLEWIIHSIRMSKELCPLSVR